MNHSVDTIRGLAIDTLSKIAENEYAQALIAPLTVHIRASSTHQDDDTGAIDYLIRLLATEHAIVVTRRRVQKCLSDTLQQQPSSESLVALLATPHPDHRLGLVQLIERLIQPMANRAWVNRVVGISKMLPLLDDPDRDLRTAVVGVVHAVLQMGGTASPEDTLRLLGDYLGSAYDDIRFAIVSCINELAMEVGNHRLLLEANVVYQLVARLRDVNDIICFCAAEALQKLSVNEEIAVRVSTTVAIGNLTLTDPVESLVVEELLGMVLP